MTIRRPSARALHEEEVERCLRMGRHAADLLGTRARRASPCACSRTAIRVAWPPAATDRRSAPCDRLGARARRARLGRRDATATPGRALDGLGARRAGYPVLRDRRRSSGVADGVPEVDAVLTGADRIAANGDVANKVGTYGLAVAASHHGTPLYVVAPTSTLDSESGNGRGHPHRGARSGRGLCALPRKESGVRRDAGPLVAAIVTEVGAHRAPYESSLPAPVRSR